MSERPALSDEQRRHLLEPQFLPPSVEVNGKTYTPEAPIAPGFKGVVWRVRDEFGRRRALKLCIYDDYQERSYLQELSRASALEPYREFARFVDAGLVELSLGCLPPQKYVCFVEEWIDGLTLRCFVKEQKELVTASFLLAYVRGLCGGLSVLQKVNLKHDDLHAGNVIIARPLPGDLPAEWSIKIIDMGSLKAADLPTKKPKDDHRHFVDHLILLWNTVHARRILTVRDRRFLTEASRLFRSMLDDEPSIALREPAQIMKQFDLAYTRASTSRPDRDVSPTSPFELFPLSTLQMINYLRGCLLARVRSGKRWMGRTRAWLQGHEVVESPQCSGG
ncbi:MAG TPA: protein kinase [Thermoanaerobaculia bacterium]|nr:protein kinase [Thermoanaerobaculia bacterium]